MIKAKFRAVVVVSVLCCVAFLTSLMSPASAGETKGNVYQSDQLGIWNEGNSLTQYSRSCGDYIAGIAVKTDVVDGINAVNVLCGGNLTAGPNGTPLWQGWQGDTADTDIYPDETENVNCPTITGDTGQRINKIRIKQLSFFDDTYISELDVQCADGSEHTIGQNTVGNATFVSSADSCSSASLSTLSINMNSGTGLIGLSFTCNLTSSGTG